MLRQVAERLFSASPYFYKTLKQVQGDGYWFESAVKIPSPHVMLNGYLQHLRRS